MPKNELDREFMVLQDEVSKIAELHSYNGFTLLNDNVIFNVELPVRCSYEIKNDILFFYFPLNVAHYFADVSHNLHFNVETSVETSLSKDIEINLNNDMLKMHFSSAFNKKFNSLNIVLYEG